MMNSYAHSPFQGFGDPDDPARFCPFYVRAENGTYPDWDQEMLSSTRQFAGSSSYVTQVGGFGPARLSLTLRFASRRDFMRFKTYTGTIGTLSLLAEYTSHDGIIRTYNDLDYEQFRDTLLLSIDEVRHHIKGGPTSCRATFQRAHDPRAAS